MQRFSFLTGTFFAALSVILGAFGAHALKSKLTSDQLQVFHTAVTYQFYHSLALILTGMICYRFASPLLNYVSLSFFLGILFFSGSLYLLSTGTLTGMDSIKSILGPITPLGGLCFIAGWILLFLVFIKNQ
jgi:uncharacterized membrane protein YgdD (TMEM256/DUF423 family)